MRPAALCVLLLSCLGASPIVASEKKPQEPVPPFPYHEEAVTFAAADSEVQLAGTLTLPESGGPFPAVYLIPGGTPFDRDQDLAGHKTFLVLADHLTRHGFAVLRMDDRGVGESTGKKMTSSIEDLAGDVIHGLEYLEGRNDVDAGRVGVIGHSAGGILATQVAASHGNLCFAVILGGAGQPFLEVMALQNVDEELGTPESYLELARQGVELLRQDPTAGFEQVAERWQTHVGEGSQGELVEALIRDMGPGLGVFLSQPFLRDLMIFDAGQALRHSTCAVLALAGEFDPMNVALPGIEAALGERKAGDFQVELVPSLNHLFQTATEVGGPPQWAQLEETFSPAALELITAWIQEHTVSG